MTDHDKFALDVLVEVCKLRNSLVYLTRKVSLESTDTKMIRDLEHLVEMTDVILKKGEDRYFYLKSQGKDDVMTP